MSFLKKKTAPAQTWQALAALFVIAARRLAGVCALLLLAGCAALLDAPRLAYRCPRGLDFEARLYQDMALLDGLRGHAVLERVPAADDGGDAALQYFDATVRASFGLGVDQRLVRLQYTGIPEPVYCERATTGDAASDTTSGAAGPPPVRASARPGPRPPAPHNPDAPVQTNIRFGGGNNQPG